MAKLNPAAAIAAILISNACAGTQLANFDGTWRLTAIDSKSLPQLPTEQIPYFTISGTTINGNDGCNNFSGQLDQPGHISSTRMACPENTVKLPLDFSDIQSHLQSGTIQNNMLSIPAHGAFPASSFERVK